MSDRHVSEELIALLDGELNDLDRARVSGHLASCAACATERSALESVLGVVARSAPVVPSSALRSSVLTAVANEPSPRSLRARLAALVSPRLAIPAVAAVAAGALLFAGMHGGNERVLEDSVELDIAAHLDLLKDYDLVTHRDLPPDISPEDLAVVAHLHELER